MGRNFGLGIGMERALAGMDEEDKKQKKENQ